MTIATFLRRFAGKLSDIHSEAGVIRCSRGGSYSIAIERMTESGVASTRHVAHFTLDENEQMVDVRPFFDARVADWQNAERSLA